MKDIFEFAKSILVLATIIFLFVSCSEDGAKETQSKFEAARKEGYSEGYDYGYKCGSENQMYADINELTIDTRSIRDIVEQVHNKYEMTPSEAFSTYDEYTYDSSHGGYTWEEYQKAIEVMYYTASLFPCE